jgi:PiT family inorganic phosphate transporter
MELWGETLTFGAGFFLLFALLLALAFEFVNGFHDTANAVATVIYTNTLKPIYAVIWSGCWNLIGVIVSGGLVAYGIIALLPHDLVSNVGSGDQAGQYVGFAMIFSLLVSAIIWNLGTWYLGLPASSSHTMIGSILGVGVANALMNGHAWYSGLNWEQIDKVMLALLVSPIVGFVASAILLLILKVAVPRKDLFSSPEKGKAPPPWIRALLMLTCTGVSFGHGNNDGQKGMGLIMIILIGVLPGAFALQNPADPAEIAKTVGLAKQAIVIFEGEASAPPVAPSTTGGTEVPPAPAASSVSATPEPVAPAAGAPAAAAPDALHPLFSTPEQKEVNRFVKSGKATPATYTALAKVADTVQSELDGVKDFSSITAIQRKDLRKNVYLLDDGIAKLNKLKLISDTTQAKTLVSLQKSLEVYTKHIPLAVQLAVALALGLGTMVGWKRIVVTVGEKIGKAHLTYGQGASAELVAAITVLGASWYGWPVSTTHVLSSGIAGTMAANRSGLQKQTLINILLAWVLTLPVTVFLGATLFSASLYAVFHILGVH